MAANDLIGINSTPSHENSRNGYFRGNVDVSGELIKDDEAEMRVLMARQ
jgi:hypothetical protein